MLKKHEKLDVENLNEVISITKKLLKIGFTFAIIALIAIATYLLKTWKVFEFLKTVLIVISPVFIGLLIAWLFDPIVTAMQKKIPRLVACIVVFLVFFGGIVLLLCLLLPSFTIQVREFVTGIPNILKEIKSMLNQFFLTISGDSGIDLTSVKDQVFNSIENVGISLTTKLPDMFINIIKSIISGGMLLILGIF